MTLSDQIELVMAHDGVPIIPPFLAFASPVETSHGINLNSIPCLFMLKFLMCAFFCKLGQNANSRPRGTQVSIKIQT